MCRSTVRLATLAAAELVTYGSRRPPACARRPSGLQQSRATASWAPQSQSWNLSVPEASPKESVSLPWVLDRAASKVADFTACGNPGGGAGGDADHGARGGRGAQTDA